MSDAVKFFLYLLNNSTKIIMGDDGISEIQSKRSLSDGFRKQLVILHIFEFNREETVRELIQKMHL